LTIADAGAGFAWTSHRLATLGHRVLAFDLSADPDFGLGAARLYPTAITAASPGDLLHPSAAGRFSPLLGSLEQPPLAAASFDVIVCNASLHYVNSLEFCLATLARALRPAGVLAVLDSPVAPRGWRPEARPGGVRCGVRVFSKDELDTALRAAGLTPTWVRVRRGALWARHRLAMRLHRHPAFDFPLVAARKSSPTP
jgi:SAM-dependent methyltransferase